MNFAENEVLHSTNELTTGIFILGLEMFEEIVAPLYMSNIDSAVEGACDWVMVAVDGVSLTVTDVPLISIDDKSNSLVG